MLYPDVETVLDQLTLKGMRYWVAGGWGVAALAGTQTRDHRDLDLAVDARDLDACVAALESLGYQCETDWLPVRVEYAAPGDRWVDLHPVVFDELGHGRQADLGGGHFDYPPEAFTVGGLNGRAIPCLSPKQQRQFHAGYEPRPQDLYDLGQLDGLK